MNTNHDRFSGADMKALTNVCGEKQKGGEQADTFCTTMQFGKSFGYLSAIFKSGNSNGSELDDIGRSPTEKS